MNEKRSEAPPHTTDEARERLIFALETGSNDPHASKQTRENAERLLRIQRLLTRSSAARYGRES